MVGLRRGFGYKYSLLKRKGFEVETKTLIAIVTCHSRLSSWDQAIRDTWLPLVPTKADAVFFVGRGETQAPKDVVELDCNDKYEGLPEKVRAIARWAISHDYDFMLKCDDDVVLKPAALLTSGYEKHDYIGRANRPPQPYVVPMGFNYWLSKRCMEIISKAELPGNFDDEKWVAKNLWDHGIVLVDDQRYALHTKLLDPPKRSLRAPRRETFIVPTLEPEYFSRCIYLPETIEVKLAEFKKVFNKYGGYSGQTVGS